VQDALGVQVEQTMPVYSAAFKARVVKRLVGPQAVSATQLAEAVGVPQPTLSRWVRELRSVEAMPRRSHAGRTGAEKLRVVQEAAALDEAALGALLRREGLQMADLTAWRQAAEQALDAKPTRPKPGASVEAKRVQELERELARKERALAEAAALLVLKKKAHAIWGDADDATPPRSAR
jgi:transposase-like protein